MLLFDMSIIQNWKLSADESGTSGLGKLKNLLTKNKYGRPILQNWSSTP